METSTTFRVTLLAGRVAATAPAGASAGAMMKCGLAQATETAATTTVITQRIDMDLPFIVEDANEGRRVYSVASGHWGEATAKMW